MVSRNLGRLLLAGLLSLGRNESTAGGQGGNEGQIWTQRTRKNDRRKLSQ